MVVEKHMSDGYGINDCILKYIDLILEETDYRMYQYYLSNICNLNWKMFVTSGKSKKKYKKLENSFFYKNNCADLENFADLFG